MCLRVVFIYPTLFLVNLIIPISVFTVPIYMRANHNANITQEPVINNSINLDESYLQTNQSSETCYEVDTIHLNSEIKDPFTSNMILNKIRTWNEKHAQITCDVVSNTSVSDVTSDSSSTIHKKLVPKFVNLCDS